MHLFDAGKGYCVTSIVDQVFSDHPNSLRALRRYYCNTLACDGVPFRSYVPPAPALAQIPFLAQAVVLLASPAPSSAMNMSDHCKVKSIRDLPHLPLLSRLCAATPFGLPVKEHVAY